LRAEPWSLLLLVALGCGRSAPPAPAPTDRAASSGSSTVPASPRWAALLAAEDARSVDGLRLFAVSPLAAERRRAALALGRTQDDAAREPLRKLLTDEEPDVRDAAAFGIGLLSRVAQPAEERALLGRLASESDVGGRVALADALGRVGHEDALPALVALLQDPEARVREQAAIALGSYGQREVEVETVRVSALAERLSDASPGVRAAAAFAIGRIGKLDREGSAPAVSALERALGDPEPDVRMMAARALGAAPAGDPAPLLAHVTDADWRVRVNVIRAIPKRAGSQAIQGVRSALRATWERVQREGLATTAVHPLVTALEVAAELTDNPSLRADVQAIHDGIPSVPGPAVAHDLVQCAAALALDRAGNWPRFVSTCGSNGIAPWRHTVLEAQLLGAAHGDQAARAGRLSKLMSSAADPQTRAAVVQAAAQIDQDAARELVVGALADADPGVIAEAADAVVKIAPQLVRIDPAAIRAAQIPDGQNPEPAATVPDTRVTDELLSLLDRYRTGPEAETLESVIDALGAMRVGPTADRLVPLLRHPVLAVRQKAEDAYKAIRGEAAPRPGPPLPPEHPLDAAAAAALIGTRHDALLRTSRGDIRVRLLTDDAPATVLNFMTLARAGFYRSKTFHRLVSNFVIQGGDPRGDGYGGPGYTIRCEDGPARYERGSVGMALAGPDTGGSQFFLTHSRATHLDGRYTLFARVVEGLERLDTLLPGDTLSDIIIQ
jgi:cyclophilin family peptidyl-prolyl cis-trans isomerase/HEAT repeat protein